MINNTSELKPQPPLIRVAAESDLNVVMRLQDYWRSDVGYLSRSAHAERIGLQSTWLVYENSEPAGYIMTHPGLDRCVHIKQVAVHPDLLRSKLGTELLDRVITAGRSSGCTMYRLRSRVDLDANQFWPTVGFAFAGQLLTRNHRLSTVNEWTRALTDPSQIIVPETAVAERSRQTRSNRTRKPKRPAQPKPAAFAGLGGEPWKG